MKPLFSFIIIDFFLPLELYPQSRHYAFNSKLAFPNTWDSFIQTFDYGGSLQDVDAVWCLTHTPMTDEERLDIIVSISTITDTLYLKPIYPVDNTSFFRDYVYETLTHNTSEVLVRLNNHSREENINFWTFMFSGIESNCWAGLMKKKTEALFNKIGAYNNENLYRYLDAIQEGYKLAISYHEKVSSLRQM